MARRGRERHSEDLSVLDVEARALVALGRIEEALDRVERSLTMRSARASSGGTLRVTALELRAHGHPDLARELLDRSIAWYRSLPPERLQELSGSLA